MRKKLVGLISIVCILTLAVGCIGTCADKNQASINTVFKLVRTGHSTQVDKLQDLLIDYTVDNNLEESVKNFLQQTGVHKAGTFALQDTAAHAPQEGQSGDRLFFINDMKGNLVSVIKVFGNPFEPQGNFIKELSGFDLLADVTGKNFKLVRIQAIGKAAINGKPFGMLAISPASGMNMQTLVIGMLRLSKGSDKREAALQNAQRGFTALGAALTEFHQLRTQKEMPLDAAIFDRLDSELYQVIAHLEQNDVGIDIQLLQDYTTSLVQQMKQLKTTRSMIHGDAHLGNFMYDSTTGSIAIVDYNELKRSVDAQGNPIGNAAFDVMSMLDIIAANKKFGLTQEEAHALRQAFIQGYGEPPSYLEQDFFALLYRLGFVAWFWMADKAHPEQFVDGKIRSVAMYMVDEIQESLAQFKAISSPIFSAILSGNFDQVKRLTHEAQEELQADPSSTDELLRAAIYSMDKQIIDHVVNEIVGKKAIGKTGKLLQWAIESDDADTIDYMLNYPLTDINARDETGNFPLYTAVIYPLESGGNLEVVQKLLEMGANPNLQNYNGDTPLHSALNWPKGERMAQLLISYGADSTLKNNQGISPADVLKANSSE